MWLTKVDLCYTHPNPYKPTNVAGDVMWWAGGPSPPLSPQTASHWASAACAMRAQSHQALELPTVVFCHGDQGLQWTRRMQLMCQMWGEGRRSEGVWSPVSSFSRGPASKWQAGVPGSVFEQGGPVGIWCAATVQNGSHCNVKKVKSNEIYFNILYSLIDLKYHLNM